MVTVFSVVSSVEINLYLQLSYITLLVHSILVSVQITINCSGNLKTIFVIFVRITYRHQWGFVPLYRLLPVYIHLRCHFSG